MDSRDTLQEDDVLVVHLRQEAKRAMAPAILATFTGQSAEFVLVEVNIRTQGARVGDRKVTHAMVREIEKEYHVDPIRYAPGATTHMAMVVGIEGHRRRADA